jgi:thiol:disulfide interchange protein DsbC
MVKKLWLKSIFLAVLVPLLMLQYFQTDVFGKNKEVISKEEARKVLSVIAPDIKIISVEPSAVEGLWEVVVVTRGKNGVLYLDSARKNIISGSIIDINSRQNLTQIKFDEINKVDFSMIPLDDALVMGDPKAKHKVVVFDDPD